MNETKEIHHHLTSNAHVSKKDIIIGNFLGGIAWGVGTVVGASVIVAIIGAILNNLGVFDFLKQIPQVPQLYTR